MDFFDRKPVPKKAAVKDVQDLSVILEASVVQGRDFDQPQYEKIRSRLLNDATAAPLVPVWLRRYRDLGQLRRYMQNDIAPDRSSYAERRKVIGDGLEPLLDALEHGVAPLDNAVAEAVRAFTSEEVSRVWGIALQRRSSDPDGAVTIARSLLESVLKHILSELDHSITAKRLQEMKLPQLYRLVAERLNLAPAQHDREDFKTILEGCAAVVSGIGSFRHEYGDVHGKGPKQTRATPRHAELVVNVAGAMASFLVQTWQSHKP